jgi:hypothetical protein
MTQPTTPTAPVTGPNRIQPAGTVPQQADADKKAQADKADAAGNTKS